MNIPDCVSPIIGYRAWQCDLSGLKSFNDESWLPNRPLEAKCRRFPDLHEAPHSDCTCGVYAVKNLDEYAPDGWIGISGEVYLWGRVVEHELGWRAQFAYPKTIVVPHGVIPVSTQEAHARLQALIAYGVDIFIEGNKRLPLPKKETGYDSAVLDSMRNAAQARRRPKYYDSVLSEAVKGITDSLANEDDVSIQVTRCASPPGRVRWSIEIEEPSERITSGSDSHPTVLLVEKEKDFHELYHVCLEQVGCKVDCALDGISAMQMYSEHGPYDVVLSGIATVDELTKRIRETKLEQAIALVGHVGATGCRYRWKIPVLRLPFQREELRYLVESAIKPQARILLVAGDNGGDLYSLVTHCPSSFDIELESSGEEALRHYRERGPYDVVLTGFRLVPKSSRTAQTGGMIGSDLAMAIRRANLSQRIVVITQGASPTSRRSVRRKLVGIPLLGLRELFDAVEELNPEGNARLRLALTAEAQLLLKAVDKAIEKQQNKRNDQIINPS